MPFKNTYFLFYAYKKPDLCFNILNRNIWVNSLGFLPNILSGVWDVCECHHVTGPSKARHPPPPPNPPEHIEKWLFNLNTQGLDSQQRNLPQIRPPSETPPVRARESCFIASMELVQAWCSRIPLLLTMRHSLRVFAECLHTIALRSWAHGLMLLPCLICVQIC